MADIVIFGAAVNARLAHWYFTRDSEHNVVAFTTDPGYREGDTFQGLPVVDFTTVAEAYPPSDYKMFVALGYTGMNRVRARKYQEAKALGYDIVSYVSTRCTYLSEEPPGENCFILEDNTVQPFVRIGDNVTLWSGNHIGHDSEIQSHCFISSHVVISGNCLIGEYSFLGVNSTLRDGIQIAPHTLLGAGSVIMKDTQEKGVYVPRPTQLVRDNSDDVNL